MKYNFYVYPGNDLKRSVPETLWPLLEISKFKICHDNLHCYRLATGIIKFICNTYIYLHKTSHILSRKKQ